MKQRLPILAALSLALVSNATAEPVRLDQAVKSALAFDPSIARAEAHLEREESSVDAARAKRGVTAGIQAQLGVLDTDFTVDHITQVPRQVGLYAELPIYQSGALGASVEAARRDATASKSALQGAHEATTLATVEAFAQLWLAERVTEVGVLRVETFRLRKEETAARLAQGTVTRTDTAMTEARLATAEADQAGNEAQLTAAQARLSHLTGIIHPEPLSPFATPLLVPESMDTALDLAMSANPQIAAAQAQRAAADFRLKEARGQFGPKVSLKARATTGEDVYFFFEDSISDVGAFLTVDIPLFTNGQKAASARGARANRSAAAADLLEAELQIRESVSGLWGDLLARRQALTAAERAETAASLAAEGAQKEYEAGLRNLVDSLDSENAYRDAQIERYRQETFLLIIQARLLSMTSQLEATFDK